MPVVLIQGLHLFICNFVYFLSNFFPMLYRVLHAQNWGRLGLEGRNALELVSRLEVRHLGG